MNNQEAIDLLDNLIGMISDNQDSDYDEALKMGIKALEKNESAEEWYKVILEKWDSAEGEYIKKEDALDKIVEQLPQRAYMKCQKAIESLPTYSFPNREKGTDGTLVYNANGHFYGVMGGDAIMDRMRGKDNETNN